jgi:transposase
LQPLLKSADKLFKKVRRLYMKKVSTESMKVLSDKRVYIGIDVHKDSWHVTARTDGEEVFNGRIPASYHSLMKLLERFNDCQVKVAYEAGPCGFSLHDNLVESGIDTIVVPPSLIPIESGNRVKTDKRDSRKLARLLESNMLKKVFVLSEEERMHRELVRTRRQLVDHRGSVARQIKSKLLFYNISSPFPSRYGWGGPYLQWLRGIVCQSHYLKESFEVLIDLYEYLTKEIKQITKSVIDLSRTDKYSQRMRLIRSIPGIGILTGMEILVELQDFARFKTSEEIASYIGLTPSEYSTGPYVRQGRITRCGNTRVRVALVESSWILVARDPIMRAKYLKLKSSKGAKRAIVAIARKLIIRIRAMLLQKAPYRTDGSMLQAA